MAYSSYIACICIRTHLTLSRYRPLKSGTSLFWGFVNLLCGQLVKFLRWGIGLSQGLHLQKKSKNIRRCRNTSFFQYYLRPRCPLQSIRRQRGIRFTRNSDEQLSVTIYINVRSSEYERLFKWRVVYLVPTLRLWILRCLSRTTQNIIWPKAIILKYYAE
jgi:hypothetical protein